MTRTKFVPKSRSIGRWTDISRAPLEQGDLIIIFQPESEMEHTFQVNGVSVVDTEKDIRLVNVTLVDSTDHEYRIGTEVSLTFNPLQYIAGVVIKKAEALSKLDATRLNDVMVVELYRWLMSKPEKDFRMPFADCVGYLATLNLIPKSENYKLQQKRLRAAMKMRPQHFNSSGGYISATGIAMTESTMQLEGITGTHTVRRVKLSKLVMGLRLILESGLFGDTVIEE